MTAPRLDSIKLKNVCSTAGVTATFDAKAKLWNFTDQTSRLLATKTSAEVIALMPNLVLFLADICTPLEPKKIKARKEKAPSSGVVKELAAQLLQTPRVMRKLLRKAGLRAPYPDVATCLDRLNTR
ncbi:MAG: hypothetical protein NHG36_17315 [Chromatiaceae bacterium]|nr:hypothetical protein [Candidatus Thioaporhodococcus sediminis]